MIYVANLVMKITLKADFQKDDCMRFLYLPSLKPIKIRGGKPKI